MIQEIHQPLWLLLMAPPMALLALAIWRASRRNISAPANTGAGTYADSHRRPVIWIVMVAAILIGLASPIGAAGLITEQEHVQASTDPLQGKCTTVFTHDFSLSMGDTDVGSSMNRHESRLAAWESFQSQGGGCEIQKLVTFDANAELVVLTDDANAISEELESRDISKEPGTGIGSALSASNDACLESLSYGTPCNVVIISDGLDQSEGLTRSVQDGIDRLVASDTSVFTVTLGTPQATRTVYDADRAREVTVNVEAEPIPAGQASLMQRIADETGGQAFNAEQTADLVQALQSVDTEIIPAQTISAPVPDVVTSSIIRLVAGAIWLLSVTGALAAMRLDHLL